MLLLSTILRFIKEVNDRFVYYYYLNLDNDKRLRPLYTGLRNTISKDNFMSFTTFIPPLHEQHLIANFLDRKTADIDKAISQKEQMIKLLNERKQIVINNAVTRGLNPDVKLKDSGIDWIGEIPEHWEVRKLKYIFDYIQTGSTPSTTNTFYFNGDIRWYTPKDLNNIILVDSERTITKKAIENNQVKLSPSDSILVVGIGATSGKCSYSIYESTFNQQITGFHTSSESNYYMYFVFSLFSNVVLSLANYTTLPIVNNEFFKNVEFAIPPLSEQQEISTYIEQQTSKISTAIALIEQEISLLKEYKASLIDSAVRGKICLV